MRHRVVILDIGDQDGHNLANVHRGRKDQGPKLLNLRIDEELARHRRRTQQATVQPEARMGEAESRSWPEFTSDQKGNHGHAGGEQVDVQHLVVLGRLVLPEELLLEC